MKTTKRTMEFTVEKSERFLVRRRKIFFTRCSKCGNEVKMLSPDAAAETAEVSQRTVYRLIEADQIHFTETEKGHLLVCLDSLFQKRHLE